VKDVARENTSHNVTVSDVPSNPQLAFWAGRIKQLVERHWNPPIGIDVAGKAKTVISFQVERSGKISDVEITLSSGNKLLDDLARNTLLRLEKVPPIPPNFPGDILKVSYEFIYNDG
jgi:TonB family protein